MIKPPASYALDRTFTHRLHTLNKLTDRVSQAAYLQHTGLPLSEGRCLSAIGAFTPLSVNDLAHRANLNKGQASRAAQSLVEQGLVRKAPSPTDGRGVVLTLTPQGERAYQQVVAVVPLLSDLGLHHVPVLDQQQRLCGLISQSDLIAALYQLQLQPLSEGKNSA